MNYFYSLIDDAVARVGTVLKAVISGPAKTMTATLINMVATAFGNLAMMTSLVSPLGIYEYEAAHGTVQRHYYKHLKGVKRPLPTRWLPSLPGRCF